MSPSRVVINAPTMIVCGKRSEKFDMTWWDLARRAPHDVAAECRRGDVALTHPADGTFERHHGCGVSSASTADIEVPTELELTFGGELAVDKCIQFLPGRTMGHDSVGAVFLPHRRTICSKSSLENLHRRIDSAGNVIAPDAAGTYPGAAASPYVAMETARRLLAPRFRRKGVSHENCKVLEALASFFQSRRARRACVASTTLEGLVRRLAHREHVRSRKLRVGAARRIC